MEKTNAISRSCVTLTFKERAEIAIELLSKQKPVTLEEARAQAQWLKEMSSRTPDTEKLPIEKSL